MAHKLDDAGHKYWVGGAPGALTSKKGVENISVMADTLSDDSVNWKDSADKIAKTKKLLGLDPSDSGSVQTLAITGGAVGTGGDCGEITSGAAATADQIATANAIATIISTINEIRTALVSHGILEG